MFEFNKDRPIYLQIADDIIDKIISGLIQSGEKIKSIRELAKIYSVNPNTIQNTTSYLVDQGIIESSRGIGNVVTNKSFILSFKKKLMKSEVNDFISKMKRLAMVKSDVLQVIEEGWKNED